MIGPLNWLCLKGKHFVGTVIINICHIDTYVRIKLKGKKIIMTALKKFFIMMKELKQKSNKILLLKNNPVSSNFSGPPTHNLRTNQLEPRTNRNNCLCLANIKSEIQF